MEKNANKTLLLRAATLFVAIAIAFVIGYVRGQMTGESAQPEAPSIGQDVSQEQGDGAGDVVEASQGAEASTPESVSSGEQVPGPEPQATPNPSPTDEPYELTFHPSQTGVDPDDEYVYGVPAGVPADVTVREDGTYTSMEEVALYIHTYGHVPSNFVSKTKARKAGWVAEEGNLQDVLPGMSIGGGGWNNDDQVMPGDEYDQWYECDINYEGGYRGSERLVFSDNGMIFYTPDHYESYARIF